MINEYFKYIKFQTYIGAKRVQWVILLLVYKCKSKV